MPTKNRAYRTLAAFACLLTALPPMRAGAQFRKYSNEFLNIGAGARGLAMGGAQVASVADGTSGYWNPAGLARVRDMPLLHLMHADYFAGIGKYDYAALAMPTTQAGRTLGISLLRFAIDDIPNTLYLVEPDGTINYNNIRSFSSADYALLLSYAREAGRAEGLRLRYGVNAKIIHRSVGSFAKAWGFGLDAGLQLEWGEWQAGAVVRDLTTTFNAWRFSFSEREREVLYLTRNDIPVRSTELTAPRVVLGLCRSMRISERFSLAPELGFDMTFDGPRNVPVKAGSLSLDPRIGLELGYRRTLFFRAGVANFQQALRDGDTLQLDKVWIYQPSLGVGFRMRQTVVDYAFTNLANQSNPLYTHVFSLRIGLGGRRKQT
jgi:hypothetical protein